MIDDYPIPIMQQGTLSSQVVQFVLRLISAKGLKVGDLVPSETAISEKLQVSRGIVREAYRALASVGIISTQSGKRPRIRAMDPSILAQFFGVAVATSQINIQQIMDLRRVIEVQAVAQASINGTEEDFRQIKEAGVKLNEISISDPQWINYDYALHVSIANAVHNPLFYLIIGALRFPLEESMRAGLESQIDNHMESQIVLLHDRIVECICRRDAIGAVEAMQEHFDAPVTSLLKQGNEILNKRVEETALT